MGLTIIPKGPVTAPVVLCDHCGEQIEEATDGNYQWRPEDGKTVYFTHKPCCRAFEHTRGGAWCAMELDVLPLYLSNNLKIDRKRAEHRARLFALIGK
jgi:hypothetical protein